MNREHLKREFRFLAHNMLPLNLAIAKKICKTCEDYLDRYPFLQSIIEEVDANFHCPSCGAVIADVCDQIVNNNFVVCSVCGACVFHKEEKRR